MSTPFKQHRHMPLWFVILFIVVVIIAFLSGCSGTMVTFESPNPDGTMTRVSVYDFKDRETFEAEGKRDPNTGRITYFYITSGQSDANTETANNAINLARESVSKVP